MVPQLLGLYPHCDSDKTQLTRKLIQVSAFTVVCLASLPSFAQSCGESVCVLDDTTVYGDPNDDPFVFPDSGYDDWDDSQDDGGSGGGGSDSSNPVNPNINCDSSNAAKTHEVGRLYVRDRDNYLERHGYLENLIWLNNNQLFDVEWYNEDFGNYSIQDETLGSYIENRRHHSNIVVSYEIDVDEESCN